MRSRFEEAPDDDRLDEPVTLTERQLRSLKRTARMGLFAVPLALIAVGLAAWSLFGSTGQDAEPAAAVAAPAQPAQAQAAPATDPTQAAAPATAPAQAPGATPGVNPAASTPAPATSATTPAVKTETAPVKKAVATTTRKRKYSSGSVGTMKYGSVTPEPASSALQAAPTPAASTPSAPKAEPATTSTPAPTPVPVETSKQAPADTSGGH